MAPRKTTKTATKSTRTTRSQKPKETVAPKQRKPMFRAGTWVTLFVLALMIGAAYYLNQQGDEGTEETVTPEMFTIEESEFLFADDRVANIIEVQPAEGETVRVERDGDNAWVLTLPFEIEAEPGLAEAAASQLTSLSIVDEIENASDASIFGLDEPAYIITIQFADGSTSTLEVGDATPSSSGYYVRVDGSRVVILTLSGIDSLTNLANFPPYLNTPTPTPPPPTETPVPPTEAAPTLEATPTP